MINIYLIGNSDKLDFQIKDTYNDVIKEIKYFLINKYNQNDTDIRLIYNQEIIKIKNNIVLKNGDIIYFIIKNNNLLLS